MNSRLLQSLLLAAFLFGGYMESLCQNLVDSCWLVVREYPQKSFPATVPPGNYSGITHLYDDIYAVVSDKSDSALYFNFRIQVNPQTGQLEKVENLGFDKYVGGDLLLGTDSCRRQEIGFDNEAIAKVSDTTVVVASEGKFKLKEYPGDWEWGMPSSCFYPNYVFESLAYDSKRHRLWTISESTLRKDGVPATPQNGNANKLRLFSFDWENENPSLGRHPIVASYAYEMDRPSTKKKAQTYVMGVSELCVLPDGQLLILEREAFVPKQKLGAFCSCKLYVVNPEQEQPFSFTEAFNDSTLFVKKKLLVEWKTNLTLLKRSFANYEGMCLGPKLDDGSLVLILLADSQNQYAGVLRDWFKVFVISKVPLE